MNTIKLNKSQKEAINHIYGPLLVLAGPGTGKTQLLSERIAHILKVTDISPQNILCLTFTENAAQNMRERLTSIIRDDAYDIHIGTYHSFGSDIIRTYPHYFEEINIETGKDTRLERPIDDLQRIQIITDIVNRLPYSSTMIGARHYVKHVVSTISELKRSLYTPQKLLLVADDNLSQVHELSPKINDILKGTKRFPSKADQAIELFGPILELFEGKEGLAESAAQSLGFAMISAHDTNKSTPLTEWKNKWLTKDEDNSFTLTDEFVHLRMKELAHIYEQYESTLSQKHLYDFDDMILRTINAVKVNDDLRFTLQEKYQFILLDEFQDTNAAQFELVKQLTDNPINEGQPNIFAVGDDDQAIYAFQGAYIGNMFTFQSAFRDVKVINLTENYRSHSEILHVAHNIADQIESRLHTQLENIDKTLIASSTTLPSEASIERHEFEAEANEYSWVASKVKNLIKSGIKPSEIAVIAPQHKYLECIVPFFAHQAVPIAYEKRENILATPLIRILRSMVELTIACSEGDIHKMNELMPQVISCDFYNIAVNDIWQINWAHLREKETSWAEHALQNEQLAPHVLFYLGLGLRAINEPLEYLLDYLTGTSVFNIDQTTVYTSPFKNYYFNNNAHELEYYEGLANLSTIREHLRAWQSGQDDLLTAKDFLAFIRAYEMADQPLINSHPLALAENSVQLLTTYKAKGLEFEHVFLLSVHDDVWGKGARTNTNKVILPPNLQHIRYQGSNEDELRRLLFVAVTRAKYGLYLTSHARKDNGKTTIPVKYLLEYSDGEIRKSTVLPIDKQLVNIFHFDQIATMHAVNIMWHSRHISFDTSLKSLLKDRLSRYQMSPTHLNTYIDVSYGGPEAFLLKTLLRFPQAPGEDGEYGNSIHYALEQHELRLGRKEKSTIEDVLKDFDRHIAKRYIKPEKMDDYRRRGHNALRTYMPARKEMFMRDAFAEVPFAREGVILGNAHLSGKIDRLEVDSTNKTLKIVDFKTGKPHTKWDRELKLLKYKQQLYFYKFLVEGSHTWKNYIIDSARLEFVEPDSRGKIVPPLEVSFNEKEEKELKLLINKVWDHIQNLDLQDISKYSKDYAGAQKFIVSLLGIDDDKA